MLRTFLQTFQKSTCKGQKEHVRFQFELGASFQNETGFWAKNHPEWMADFHFYQVTNGDKIVCSDSTFCYGIASYLPKVEERLIYTYCYQQEENWSSYAGDFSTDNLRCDDSTILQDGWIRIAVRRKDGGMLTPNDLNEAKKAFILIRQERIYQEKAYYKQEIARTIQSVIEKRGKSCLTFGLMADSHYVINGGWEDSVANLRAVNSRVGFDAMIHLGDLTDGMVPLAITKEYTKKVMEDLQSLKFPVYLTLGNHDSNYFHNNPEWMDEQEQSRHYLNRQEPWYYVDFEKQKLRCLFLHSFNHREKIRYGFPMKEVEWVEEVLADTPERYKILVLSHVPLLAEMHYWSKEIRNSGEMLQVLEGYVNQGGCILAYIHGHNHADQICYEKKFPIVSIGCAKCEDVKDIKPVGAVTYDRKMGTVTQELWDVMVVDVEKGKIRFVRFGAGEDREI